MGGTMGPSAYRTAAEAEPDAYDYEMAKLEAARIATEKKEKREKRFAKCILFLAAEGFIAMLCACTAHDTHTPLSVCMFWAHAGLACVALIIWALVKLAP